MITYMIDANLWKVCMSANELIVNIKVNVSTSSRHEYTSLTKHTYFIKHGVSYASLSMTKTFFFGVSDMYITQTRTTSTPIHGNDIFDMDDHITSVATATILRGPWQSPFIIHSAPNSRGFPLFKKSAPRASNCTTVAHVMVGTFFNRTFSIYNLIEFSRHNVLEIKSYSRKCCLTNQDIIWYTLLVFVDICVVITLTHWGLLIHTIECRYNAVQCSKILHQ